MIIEMGKALDGLKVLDLTHAYNGPFCTTLLADNGAEVIKIEPPTGDQCRTWGPLDKKSGESGFFAFLNRNKKGITLNLKNQKAKEIFYDLVKNSDVVVENFRNGVAKKLDIDYEALKKINPKIIYAAGSGFGQYGPLSHRPCYDVVAQSMGGMVNLTGFPDQPPTKVGPSVADNVTGIYLCVGVLMALYNREKTGKGQMVDVAMLDTIFSLLENSIVVTTMTGKIPQRKGNIDPSIAPFDIYKAKDGYIAIGVGNDKLFNVLCDVIEKPELINEPKYKTNDLRCQNYTCGLQDILAEWTKNKEKKYIEDLFDKAGIPCGPVLDMKEAINHPQIKAREMMVEIDHPTIGPMYFQGCPIKLSETPGSVDTPAPILGQHNAEILGISEDELKRLKEDNVI
jgi:CoA:oxalate CoA-transferase